MNSFYKYYYKYNTHILCTLFILLFLLLFFIIFFHINKDSKIYNNIDISKTRNLYTEMNDYSIQEIPNFLNSEECDKIIELSNGKLFPSKVYTNDKDLYETDTRNSHQCWLNDNDTFIKNISDKIKKYTNTPNNYQEELQVVNYQPGGFFKSHYDACEGDEKFCKRMNGEHGPRLLTVLIYLNDNFTGGETVFPLINKTVKPKKGKAVIFKNIDNNGIIIKQALHGGEPVISGEKWIANKWIHIN